MVTAYVPEAGDIVFIDFDPQVGHEQAKRRPALVLTRSTLQPSQRACGRLSVDEQAQNHTRSLCPSKSTR